MKHKVEVKSWKDLKLGDELRAGGKTFPVTFVTESERILVVRLGPGPANTVTEPIIDALLACGEVWREGPLEVTMTVKEFRDRYVYGNLDSQLNMHGFDLEKIVGTVTFKQEEK